MADTDTIKAVAVDGRTLSVTRLALATAIAHWIWCSERGFNIGQQIAPLTDDLRLALAAIKSGTGNAQ